MGITITASSPPQHDRDGGEAPQPPASPPESPRCLGSGQHGVDIHFVGARISLRKLADRSVNLLAALLFQKQRLSDRCLGLVGRGRQEQTRPIPAAMGHTGPTDDDAEQEDLELPQRLVLRCAPQQLQEAVLNDILGALDASHVPNRDLHRGALVSSNQRSKGALVPFSNEAHQIIVLKIGQRLALGRYQS